jgi:hypothetical protein
MYICVYILSQVSDEECYKQVAPLAQDLLKRASALGTHLTGFTGTNVHTLTPRTHTSSTDLNDVNGDLLIYAALGGVCQSRLEAKGVCEWGGGSRTGAGGGAECMHTFVCADLM